VFLKVEAVFSSETSVNYYQAIRRHISDEVSCCSYRHVNPRLRTVRRCCVNGNGICRAGLVMQDCAQYTEVDKEMKEVMLKVLGKERVSGNGCGFSLATMAAHTF